MVQGTWYKAQGTRIKVQGTSATTLVPCTLCLVPYREGLGCGNSFLGNFSSR
jgi:hypothetical protein